MELDLGPEGREGMDEHREARKTFQTEKLAQAKVWKGEICLKDLLRGELFLRLHHSEALPIESFIPIS